MTTTLLRSAALLAASLLAGCGDKPSAPPPAPRDPLAITAHAELAASLKTAAPVVTDVREALRVPGRIEAQSLK